MDKQVNGQQQYYKQLVYIYGDFAKAKAFIRLLTMRNKMQDRASTVSHKEFSQSCVKTQACEETNCDLKISVKVRVQTPGLTFKPKI